jgi:methionyl aminopeptidase
VPNADKQNAADRTIPVYNEEEIESIRYACKVARGALDAAHKAAVVGETTEALDTIAHEYIIERDCYPSPLNYWHFPRSICTSLNEVICHGIPDLRKLKDGDLLNIDVSAYNKEGFHGDVNETYLIGPNYSEDSRYLTEVTFNCLMKSIEFCKPGKMYREVGNIISNYAEPLGFGVVRDYYGHGVGRVFHQAPQVPHYKKNKAVGFMKPGHIFTIEPMINQGEWMEKTWNDKWTSTTVDGLKSA